MLRGGGSVYVARLLDDENLLRRRVARGERGATDAERGGPVRGGDDRAERVTTIAS